MQITLILTETLIFADFLNKIWSNLSCFISAIRVQILFTIF
jgi:hypothetical protein